MTTLIRGGTVVNHDHTRRADVLVDGSIDRTTALDAEIDDDDEVWRPRLILSFDNRHFGRLHQLVRSL